MSEFSAAGAQASRSRKVSLHVVLWAFGLATSLLLFGMWGRTVAVDSETVKEAARTVVDADLATERVTNWLGAGLETASDTDSATAQAVTRAVAERPEFAKAVDLIVGDFVSGLFADTGDDPVVHVEEAVRPLVPIVVAEFNRREVPVTPERIDEALDAAAVIELDTGEAASVANVVSDAHALLTNVVLLAAAALLTAGVAAIALSEKRYAMLRTLSLRFVLSAVSYAIVFRMASWALDPSRGRSPVLGGGSVLLGSNNEVFLIPAALAGTLAAFGGFVAWRIAGVRRANELSDDDTREFAAV